MTVREAAPWVFLLVVVLIVLRVFRLV